VGKKASTNKTWASVTAYFKESIKEQETYSKLSGRSSKRARYESAAMARKKVAERAREDSERSNSEADLGDEVRDYIVRLSSEKSEESEQLYKVEQRHQVMADQAAAMKSQTRTKDDQSSALTAQVATLTKSIETLTTTITCLLTMHAAGGRGNGR